MKNIVEINGRKYDAKTGKPIKSQPVNSNSIAKHSKKSTPPKGRFVDGIKRHLPQSKTTKATAKSVTSSKTTPHLVAKAPRKSISSKSATRTAQKPKTLLRTIVKKPLGKPAIHGTSAPIASPGSEIRPATTNQSSLATIKTHVKSVAKSPQISRFGEATKTSYTKVVNNLSVVAQKVPEAAPPIFTKKLRKSEKPQVFSHKIVNPKYQTKSRSESSAKRLSRRVKIKSKAVAISASVLAVIVLGGFLAYQSIPSFAMRIAARGAGFSGQLPGDTPDGYAFGGLQYEKGVITMDYRSNSDNRQFTIIQKPSTWTSESLLINFLEARGYKHQTSASNNGLTYYIYDKSNITWVENGIWFNVTSEGSLSSDQLIELAGSF